MQLQAAAVIAGLLFAKALVDAQSILDERPGQPAWQPHVLEFTSAAFFAAILWPLWQGSRRLRRLGWPASFAAHLALCVPLVLAHVLWLAATRALLFAAAGSRYRFDWSWAQLVYEGRKDMLTLLALVGLGWLLDRLFVPPPSEPAPVPGPAWRLAVKDGGRTLYLAADEISHASSAGNYVELATRHGTVLHRVTMAALAEELAPQGFARIHRAHLVRVAAVASVASEGSGDFAVMLADGTRLPGSRRYRTALAQFPG
ncbi:LytTR family DNA-binding domain-containing protein [Sandarakinorhabdus rubra]|uniref:LytTR family DNA-binding domain-containing protein n=1 Tax=Sandarakinorhabdus rubra TaxID=2672568 RepID=UPI0013DB3124|nr:LytTR family DNA-binding domain-containing protein [Sandarakinorhabdus rubra]